MKKTAPPRYLLLAFIIVTACMAVLATTRTLASGGAFELPDAGCPQAHCDLRMTGRVKVFTLFTLSVKHNQASGK